MLWSHSALWSGHLSTSAFLSAVSFCPSDWLCTSLKEYTLMNTLHGTWRGHTPLRQWSLQSLLLEGLSPRSLVHGSVCSVWFWIITVHKAGTQACYLKETRVRVAAATPGPPVNGQWWTEATGTVLLETVANRQKQRKFIFSQFWARVWSRCWRGCASPNTLGEAFLSPLVSAAPGLVCGTHLFSLSLPLPLVFPVCLVFSSVSYENTCRQELGSQWPLQRPFL